MTSKGQLVVPARLRRKLGIVAGTRIRFIEHGSQVLMQPVTPEYVWSLDGVLKSPASVGKLLIQERKDDERKTRRKLAKVRPR